MHVVSSFFVYFTRIMPSNTYRMCGVHLTAEKYPDVVDSILLILLLLMWLPHVFGHVLQRAAQGMEQGQYPEAKNTGNCHVFVMMCIFSLHLA